MSSPKRARTERFCKLSRCAILQPQAAKESLEPLEPAKKSEREATGFINLQLFWDKDQNKRVWALERGFYRAHGGEGQFFFLFTGAKPLRSSKTAFRHQRIGSYEGGLPVTPVLGNNFPDTKGRPLYIDKVVRRMVQCGLTTRIMP